MNIKTINEAKRKKGIVSSQSGPYPSGEKILSVLEWFLLFCPFLFGCYFSWASALVSLVLIVLLLFLIRRGLLCCTCSVPFLTAVSIVFFHLGGIFWGSDHGMALVGAIQFLPLPLFVLILEQYAPEQRMGLLRKMPYVASAMVVLSFLLSHIPLLESWFLVAGRQAGFFQYPNTYAIYLLFALVFLLFESPLQSRKLPWLIILTLGIILSGSRIVFFLLLTVFFVFFISEKNKYSCLSILGVATLSVLGSALFALFTGNRDSIGRFLTFSFTASEFVGRLLYMQDALPIIIRHPLGLGYTGYRWLQGSFQTGVYSVQHVHNELLQLLLDVGWIPAVLFLWALWCSLRSREGGLCRKLLLAILLFHCLLDFDTQFVSMAMLLFLVLDIEPRAEKKSLSSRSHLCAGMLSVLALGSIWIGSASFLAYVQSPSAALRLYPGYTTAMVSLLSEVPEKEMGLLADRILRLNHNVALAHDAKAKTDFSAGSFSGMYTHKQEAIRLSRYNLMEYLDYFDMLRYAHSLYLRAGDNSSADRCLSLLAEIPGMLEAVDAQTSLLGRIIAEQPELDLPESYRVWLEDNLT